MLKVKILKAFYENKVFKFLYKLKSNIKFWGPSGCGNDMFMNRKADNDKNEWNL